MPRLYGALMAGVAYVLFTSQLLSGHGDQGLFTSNLFPKFTTPTGEFSLKSWFETRLVEGTDLSKLLIWSFIAGYSEKFVTGILQQLERSQGQNPGQVPWQAATPLVSTNTTSSVLATCAEGPSHGPPAR